MKFFILLAPVVVLILGFPAYGAVKWPAEQLLPSFSKPASPQDLISIPPEGTDQPAADAVLFSSLKGLINRTKPRIWTAEGTGTDKFKWLADLGLSYTEISDPWTLFTKYHREIKGLVVYDDAQPDTINLASTIAGQRNALVVAPQSVAMLTAAPYNFPILVDLRGKFADKLSVYQYLYDNYWTGATHRVLVGLNPTTLPGALREYAIAVNSAVVWLDPRKPDQKALLDRFLSTMAPGTLFMGWWPEEGTGVTAASSYGVVTCASDWCTNLSNFSGTSRKVAVKGTPKDMPQIENKIYLAFIMSDGDNLQYQEHHLRDIWNDPARGTVPMGWTMSPMMLDAMPGVLNYYYKTATPNDCLLCGLYGLVFGLVWPWLAGPGWLRGLALGIIVALIGLLGVPVFRRYQPGAAWLSLSDFTTLMTAVLTYGLPASLNSSKALIWGRSLLVNGFWGIGAGVFLSLLLPRGRRRA